MGSVGSNHRGKLGSDAFSKPDLLTDLQFVEFLYF